MPYRLITVLLVLLVPILAAAQITPEYQGRFIDAYVDIYNDNTGEGGSDGGYDEAPDYAVFDSAIYPSWFEDPAYGDVYAEQTSSIQPFSLSALGAVGGFVESMDPDWYVDSFAGSFYMVEFSIAQPHTFQLSGFYEADGFCEIQISLWDDIGGNWFDIFDSYSGQVNVGESGSLPAGTYVFSIDASGYMQAFGEGGEGGEGNYDLSLDLELGTTSVGDPASLARYLRAGPNPVTDRTSISFALGRGAPVSVDVLDARGRRVRSLDSAAPSVGSLIWDGRDDHGTRAPSGLYFVQVRSGNDVLRKKVSLIR